MFENINWVAVVVAGIASMVVGFLWYSPVLFGKQWMKLNRFTQKDMEAAKKEMGKTYGLSFVAALITAFVLSRLVGMLGVVGAAGGMEVAFWLWLGFVMPVQYTGVLFESKNLQLFMINTSYQLVSFLVMGVVLTSWV